MELTAKQVQQYEEQGWLSIPAFLSEAEMAVVRAEISILVSADAPGNVFEKDNKTVRALHGCHNTSPILRCLTMHPKLLQPAKQLLGSDVYVHQFKINLKAAFSGELWPWHQDFIFWNREDGMPTPRAINTVLFVDVVNEFNSPLYLIPGSHQHGILSKEVPIELQENETNKLDWIANFKTNLKFSVEDKVVDKLVAEHGIVAPKGPIGSVLLFHSNLVHASTSNISPYKRNIVIITYNSVENIPPQLAQIKCRPEFLASRDYSPLEPTSEDTLFSSTKSI